MPSPSRVRLRPFLPMALVLAAASWPAPRGGAQDVVFNEFLSLSGGGAAGGFRDEDGDSSDWMEIHNRGAEAVDLGGWFLTDDPALPGKWRFPPHLLPAGGFLVVFASGKDRAGPAPPFHTNFKLDGDGEYLALVRPDGSLAHDFAPGYPPQFEDVSYGLFEDARTAVLLAPGAPARFLVPRDGALGLRWTEPGFDDASWTPARNGLAFEAPGDAPVETQSTNLALDGSPSQSSTLGSFVADLAIDGHPGNFTHTAAGRSLPATWELDLGDAFEIHAVVIHNRGDGCCQSRLRDITVSILDPLGAAVFESELLNPENVLGGGGTTGPARLTVDLESPAGGPVRGRRVRIVRTPDPDLSGTGGRGNSDEPDVLSLGEVEVLNRPSAFGQVARTDVEADLSGVHPSIYVRVPFPLEGAAAAGALKLRVSYDDGFVAFLNGREVARRNAPDAPAWDSTASAERPDHQAIVPEEIDLSAHRAALVPGTNVLALHGLNLRADDTDFLLVPELVAVEVLGTEKRYYRLPTPGAPNGADGILGLVEDTKFSLDRGFYDRPLEVEITTGTAGAEIRYTLNGAAPTPTSGKLYAGPVRIERTSTLRAAAFKPGLEPTNVDTHTYIFTGDVVRQDAAATIAAGFPASWGGTAPDYGMDPDVIGPGDRYGGKYAATVEDDLRAVPTLSIVMSIDDLFGPRGIYVNSTSRGLAWERPASVELIDPAGGEEFQVNAGIRIHGGAFRSHGLTKKHSLRLLFKAVYGATKLRHPLLGPGAADRFDTLVLRANSNDGWQWADAGGQPLYIRDSFARQTALEMGVAASHETFAHVYLNGIYWGLYNVVERPDASFGATYFGGEKEDWDSISNGEAHSGDLAAWSAMLGRAAAGLSTAAQYQAIQGNRPDGSDDPALPAYLDMENLADYMIVNLWVGNTDWPNKNYWVGRRRTDSTGFKFFLWDTEWSMGIRSDLGTNQTGVSTGVAAPYAAARASAEFRLLFADRVHRHFFDGGALHVDPVRPAWDPGRPEANVPARRFLELAARVERALVAESARWGDQHAAVPYTVDEHWRVELNRVLAGYLPRRSATVLEQFRAAGLYPRVAAPSFSAPGGHAPPGLTLAIRAPAGEVLYTLDGTDPRLLGGGVSPTARRSEPAETVVLVPEGAEVKLEVPTGGADGLAWTGPEFDDRAWAAGRTGVGYERATGYEGLINTDLEAAMYNASPGVYLRLVFEVDDPARFSFLTLLVKYDDGFVAYLNGEPAAAANAPAAPQWNSRAAASHADAQSVVFESFDLTARAGALRPGRNVLAIHGLNSAPNSDDFLILPRLEAARAAAGGIVLERSTVVRARALLDGVWSALNDATFIISPLRITEVMYHPRAEPPPAAFDAEEFEFIEIKNSGIAPADLAGARLAGGIEFDFSAGRVGRLGPGELAVVVKRRGAFEARYGAGRVLVAGEYTGRLDNAGDTVRLEGRLGEAILDLHYLDSWAPATDGEGRSLVIADPSGPPDSFGDAASWRASRDVDGSPGRDDGEDHPDGGLQLPGDANQDGALDLSDAIGVLGLLFLGFEFDLPCGGELSNAGNRALLDLNADLAVDLADVIHLLGHLFLNGPPPARGTECRRIEGCAEACRG